MVRCAIENYLLSWAMYGDSIIDIVGIQHRGWYHKGVRSKSAIWAMSLGSTSQDPKHFRTRQLTAVRIEWNALHPLSLFWICKLENEGVISQFSITSREVKVPPRTSSNLSRCLGLTSTQILPPALNGSLGLPAIISVFMDQKRASSTWAGNAERLFAGLT